MRAASSPAGVALGAERHGQPQGPAATAVGAGGAPGGETRGGGAGGARFLPACVHAPAALAPQASAEAVLKVGGMPRACPDCLPGRSLRELDASKNGLTSLAVGVRCGNFGVQLRQAIPRIYRRIARMQAGRGTRKGGRGHERGGENRWRGACPWTREETGRTSHMAAVLPTPFPHTPCAQTVVKRLPALELLDVSANRLASADELVRLSPHLCFP